MKLRTSALYGALMALAACAGPDVTKKRELAALQSARNHRSAVERIRAAEAEYGPANLVLYNLDLAQALADAGMREEADRRFAAAQDRMEQLWTLSVSKRAGSALANENVDDYRGEDFERALSHVLRALNFVAMGKRRDALIEAQRAEDFLDEAGRVAPRKRSYSDDAFARWLAAMLYEDLGLADDARISREAAERAYARQMKLYGAIPPPAPAGAGEREVVLVHLDGPAPRKVRKSGGGPLGLVLSTSYPAYEAAVSSVAVVELAVGEAWAPAVVVHDVAAIAARDLEERLLALKARSTLRAAVKLAGTAVGVNAVESEFADVRGWATMPSRIRVARLKVPAHARAARVRYLDAAGRELESRELPLSEPGRRVWLVDRTAL